MNRQKKILAILETDFYYANNRAIEQHLARCDKVHVVFDQPAGAEKLATRVGPNALPVSVFDIRSYDRDHYYGISTSLFNAFERYAVSLIRSRHGRDLDINIENLRLDYLDSLSATVAESHSYRSLLDRDWDEVLFYTKREGETFVEFLRLGRILKAKSSYFTVVGDKVVRLRIFRTAGLPSRKAHSLETLARRLNRRRDISTRLRQITEMASSLILVAGSKSFYLDLFPKQLGVDARRHEPVTLARHEDVGICQHIHKLMEAKPRPGRRQTMIIAEAQSRPYAETMALALQRVPVSLDLVVLMPTYAAAASEFFATAISEAAVHRLGEQRVAEVTAEHSKNLARPRGRRAGAQAASGEAVVGDFGVKVEQALYPDLTKVLIRTAFPNVSFYYVDLRGADSAFVTQDWIDRNLMREKVMITDAISYQFEQLPFRTERLRQAFAGGVQATVLHTYQSSIFVKELFNHLDGALETVVTFSSRHWLSRIAAIEARRRSVKVVDWQCTILGKTPVFPKIVADRALAIFKNAAELYETYFGFKKSQIDIVGFPRFIRRMRSLDRSAAERVLGRHGLSGATNLHVFASQPFGIKMQEKLLTDLAEAARMVDARILVCAHPSQRVNGQDKHLEDFVAAMPDKNLVYSSAFEASDLFVFAKSVIAYSSTFIFEAAHFGWPAILFDPLDEPHVLDYEGSSEIMSARTVEELASCMVKAQHAVSGQSNQFDFLLEEQKCAAAIWDGICRPVD